MSRDGLGPAGTTYATGAMGGDMDDPEMPDLAPAPAPDQRWKQSDEVPNIFVDPEMSAREDVEPEPDRPARKVQPRSQPIKLDWTREAANTRAGAREQNQQYLRETAAPMLQRLKQLPDPALISPDQVAALSPEDNARYIQAIADRTQIVSNLNMLPVLANLQNQLGDNLATNITQIQRRIAEQHPEIAATVLDQAKAMPYQAQAIPETYEFLVNHALGAKVREEQATRRISSAGARASAGGRGGYGGPERGAPVTSHQRDQLNRLFGTLEPSRRKAAVAMTLRSLGDE